jgi:hypothetical protein
MQWLMGIGAGGMPAGIMQVGDNGLPYTPAMDPDGSGEAGWINPDNGEWFGASAGAELGLTNMSFGFFAPPSGPSQSGAGGGVSAPNNGTPSLTPQQQKQKVCAQAAKVTKDLSGIRTASIVVGAAGAACIGVTGGGCAPVGGIAVTVGVSGTLVFGGAELINSAIANWGLGCDISW